MKISSDGLLNSISKPKVDFSYLEKYRSRYKYQIPTIFARSGFTRGQSFEARITHIYDPSKFWMVTKFRELDIFQRYLFRFYYMNRAHYRIPEDEIELNLYCVAFIDSAYYRGVIVGFPDNQQEKQEVQIFFIDYGMLGSTAVTNIYYIAEKFMKVPQFVIRAAIANIRPLKNSYWSTEDVTKFHELVVDKVLIGTVVNTDINREILEVYLSEKNAKLTPVHGILIIQKYAQYVHIEEHAEDRSSNKNNLKYPYLFPSHEALESGKLPITTGDAEYQLQIAPESIVSRYYPKPGPCENGIL